HAELRRRDRGVEGGGDAQPQRHAGVSRIDDAVIPQPGAGVIGMALVLVLIADRRLEGLLFLRAPGLPLRFHAVAADLGQHAGGLLSPHHGDAGVRPHPQEAWAVGPAAHTIIASLETAADYDR